MIAGIHSNGSNWPNADIKLLSWIPRPYLWVGLQAPQKTQRQHLRLLLSLIYVSQLNNGAWLLTGDYQQPVLVLFHLCPSSRRKKKKNKKIFLPFCLSHELVKPVVFPLHWQWSWKYWTTYEMNTKDTLCLVLTAKIYLGRISSRREFRLLDPHPVGGEKGQMMVST